MEDAFDEDEREFVELLREAGLRKNGAKILVYIASNEGAKTTEIERDLRLRQPEVSLATNELKGKGWIKKVRNKKSGQKKAWLHYYLDKPLDDIIEDIVQEKKKKIREIEQTIEEVKRLTKKISR